MQLASESQTFLLGGSGRRGRGMKVRAGEAHAVAGSTLIVDVLANDMPPKGDSLTLVAASSDKGTVSIAPDNRLSVSTAGLSAEDSPVSVRYTARSAGGEQVDGQLLLKLWPPLVAAAPGPLTALEGSAARWPLVPGVFAGGRAPIAVRALGPIEGALSLDGQDLVAAGSGGGFRATVALEATDALGQRATADVAVRVDETLTIASGGALLTFVGTGADPIAVTIPAGTPYAGEYLVDPAPVNGAPPRLVAPGTVPFVDAVAGRLRPGVFYSDPATGGTLEVAVEWRGSGGTVLAANTLDIPDGTEEVRIGVADANGLGPVYRLDVPAAAGPVLRTDPAGLTLVSAPAVSSPALRADPSGIHMGSAPLNPPLPKPVFRAGPDGLTLVSASPTPPTPIRADTAGLHMEAA